MARKRRTSAEVLEVEMGYSTPCHIPLKLDGTPMRTDKDGYSVASFDVYSQLGKTMHRRLWVALNGSVPEKMVLDHLCKHRACCNVGHLELVTSAENTRRGTATKLTAEDVVKIRALRAGGLGPTAIARMYGMSPGHISHICIGGYWTKDGSESYRTKMDRKYKAVSD